MAEGHKSVWLVIDACVVTDGSEVIAEDSRAQERRWTSRAPPVPLIVRTVSVGVKQHVEEEGRVQSSRGGRTFWAPRVPQKSLRSLWTSSNSEQTRDHHRAQELCGGGRRK